MNHDLITHTVILETLLTIFYSEPNKKAFEIIIA